MNNTLHLTHYYCRHLLQYLDKCRPNHGLTAAPPRAGLRGYTHQLEEFNQLAGQAEQLSGDPLFTLAAATRSLPPGHGILGLLLQACRSLGEASLLGHKLQRISRSGVYSHLQFDSQKVNATLDCDGIDNQQLRSFSEYCLGSYLGIANTLYNRHQAIRPVAVYLAHSPRAALKRYQQLFNTADVFFNQPQNRIVFERELMDRPLQRSDGREKDILLQEAIRQMAELQPEQYRTLQIEALVHRQPELLMTLTLPLCADRLNLSVSTLKRHLQREHTSFQQLLEKLRLQQAEQLLSTSEISIEAIALQCGFSGASAFGRAFRRHHKMTALSYRRQQHFLQT